MAIVKLHDDDRDFRDGVARDLRSCWVKTYLGLYLSADERERFRRLDPVDLADLIALIKRMKRRGFDPVLAREVRRAVLDPGEPDLPVAPRAAVGTLFGPPAVTATPDASRAGRRPGTRPVSGRGRRRDDPGQRLLPFMTPGLLVPD